MAQHIPPYCLLFETQYRVFSKIKQSIFAFGSCDYATVSCLELWSIFTVVFVAHIGMTQGCAGATGSEHDFLFLIHIYWATGIYIRGTAKNVPFKNQFWCLVDFVELFYFLDYNNFWRNWESKSSSSQVQIFFLNLKKSFPYDRT